MFTPLFGSIERTSKGVDEGIEPATENLPALTPAITPASFASAARQPAAIALLWVIVFLQIRTICVQMPRQASSWDFSVYYLSAQVLKRGLNPYQTGIQVLARQSGMDVGDVYRPGHPPTFLLLMRPLAAMPERQAYYLWQAFNAVLLAASLALLIAPSPGVSRAEVLVMAALALLYVPVRVHFFFAQSNIVILFLLVLMMKSMARGHERGAGLCLAAAGLLRIFPLLLMGYLAIRRRWRALGWTLIGLAAGGLVTVGFVGLYTSLSFLPITAYLTSQPFLSMHGNIALAAVVSRAFWVLLGSNLSPAANLVRHAVIAAGAAVILGLTIRATFVQEPDGDSDWRAFSMWIAASIVLSPTAWVHYMVLFFIPFAQLVSAARRSAASIRAQWMAIFSYALMILTMAFLPPAGISGAELSRTGMPWMNAIAIEGWFVSAFLGYWATYWFTVDRGSIQPSWGKPRDLGRIVA